MEAVFNGEEATVIAAFDDRARCAMRIHAGIRCAHRSSMGVMGVSHQDRAYSIL